MAQVLIDRTSLGGGPLVLTDDGSGTYMLTEGGLGRPAVTARATTATSPWLHGEVVVQAVREQSALTLEVLTQAEDQVGLEEALAELDEALWQFTYAVTVQAAGTSTTWTCSPASYGAADGVTTSDNVRAHYQVWTITIPCYPIPVS